jgi:hypothetical protein
LPIVREDNGKPDSPYPFASDRINDVCYYTTPNLIGRNLYCENPETPENMLEANTPQTLMSCHAFC